MTFVDKSKVKKLLPDQVVVFIKKTKKIPVGKTGLFTWMAEFKCFCGKIFETNCYRKVKSCGCIRYTRGNLSNTRLYSIWVGMIRRCYEQKNKNYKFYGAKGVEVCKKWHDFINFYNDVVENYKDGLSLDRYPNNKGNYEPNNVRWATPKEQNNNYSKNVFITYNGLTKTKKEWADYYGLTWATVDGRIRRYGLSDLDLIFKPPNYFWKRKNRPQKQKP